jgi:hypothetical protein
MKLEDVLEVLPILVPENFLGSIHFHLRTWTMLQDVLWNFTWSHYYLKDLKWMYYACCGLPYGKEHQTLLIDDEPKKCFGIQSGVVFFLNHSRNKCCQIIRCNGWTLHLICGHPWLNCHWPRWFEFIMTIWLNILTFVWIFLQKNIIVLSNMWIMKMALIVITNPL